MKRDQTRVYNQILVLLLSNRIGLLEDQLVTLVQFKRLLHPQHYSLLFKFPSHPMANAILIMSRLLSNVTCIRKLHSIKRSQIDQSGLQLFRYPASPTLATCLKSHEPNQAPRHMYETIKSPIHREGCGRESVRKLVWE